MQKVLLLLVVAGLLLLLAPTTTAPFDYYRFSFDFPGALCQNRDCQADDLGNLSDFSINMHGFWPQMDTGSIDFCLYNGYDESELSSDVLQKMSENWVGTYNPTSGFRSHEWGKHGTCWAKQYYKNSSEFLKDDNYYELMNEYFALVMKIKTEAGLEDLFFSDRTSERMEFQLEDVMGLIQGRFSVTGVELECEEINGEQYLTEARVCLDLEYNYIDCPNLIASCKPGTVIVQAYMTTLIKL